MQQWVKQLVMFYFASLKHKFTDNKAQDFTKAMAFVVFSLETEQICSWGMCWNEMFIHNEVAWLERWIHKPLSAEC